MPIFSQRSQNNLSECHEDLQTIFNEVIKYFDCTIIEGHRGKEEQNEAFNKGNSQLKYPKSKHNKEPSMAVDVVPYPIEWKNTERMIHFGGFVIGIARLLKNRKIIDHNFRWGGNWKNDNYRKKSKFVDMPHYELI